MTKPAVKLGRANTSPPAGRIGRFPCPGPEVAARAGSLAAAVPCRLPGAPRPSRPPSGSMSCLLGRSEPSVRLLVSLSRHAPETGGAARGDGLARSGGPLRSPAALTAGPVLSGPSGPGTRPGGGSPGASAGPRQLFQRNGQMEHSTQVAAGLRRGVRRGAAIATREEAGLWDQVLTTFGNESCIQSNIFGFVMT
jgi:hypothetical protein